MRNHRAIVSRRQMTERLQFERLSLEKVAEGCQHPDPVANDLCDRCRRGTPSGSFAAQEAVGPDIAVPNPTMEQNTKPIRSSAKPLQRPQDWLQKEVEHEGKDDRQYDLLRYIERGEQRQHE